jgi:hypothetical protein
MSRHEYRNEQQRIQALGTAVKAARTAAERAEDHKNGLSDFESRRSLLILEDQLVPSRSSMLLPAVGS